MYYLEELTVTKFIVHILDPSLSLPVLSMEEMPPSPDAQEFFANHIIKTLNDDGIKTCQFSEEYNMFLTYLKAYINDEVSFTTFTGNIASQLFAIMSAHIAITPSDLAIVIFQYKGSAYVAVLKMNYQNTYIHYTDFEKDVNVNHIILHKTTLPNINQRIGEAVIINLSNLEVMVLEKTYELDGIKENYLSKRFLKCMTKLSSKEQLSIVKKATDTIAKKFYDEDIEKKMTLQQELYNTLEDTGEIDLKKYAGEAFKNQIEIKEAFMEVLEKKGLQDPIIQLSEKTITRSFDKQRILTENGIEIKIPMALYDNPEHLEWVTAPDGKVSILIKNITVKR